MKATIDLPEDLFRQIKATAALRGLKVKDLVAEALSEKLARLGRDTEPTWRDVFGAADREATDEVDAIVAAELEAVDHETWR